MKRCYAALVCLAPAALGFQLPFEIPFFKGQAPGKQVILPDDSPHAAPRVAIIGAGAGGTSAAFWIGKAKERFGLDVEVDVYDKANYVGGRSTVVHPFGDKSLRELELGGSVFVKANKNMWRATDEFNLTRRDFKEEDYETTVWDGEKFLFRYKGGWWDTIKLMWRFGLASPRATTAAVTKMIDSFIKIYTPEISHWSNMTELSAALGFANLLESTVSEHLLSLGVSSQYIYEVVEAATLVNYGQDADAIHALEGAVSMAADNAAGVDGGNYLVFENFLNRSKANVYLDTEVTSVLPKKSGGSWTVKSARGTQHYKGVILAAPFHQASIAVPPSIADQIPAQPYVHLHVTLLATNSSTPSPAYFGLPEGSSIPQMILTSQANARLGGKLPEFNSLSYHGQVREGEYFVKIFSDAPISDEWLDLVFNGSVTWVHRKLWQSYPKLPPTTSFPPIKLDEGFYYVNAFEPFISTMETETVAARNVVDLLLDDLFQSGICGPKNSTSETEVPRVFGDDFVYGWDC